MAHAYPDLVAAPRAEVLVLGLIGLDPEHVERAKAFRGAGHGSGRLGEEGPGKQQDNYDDDSDHHGDVGLLGSLPGPERVEAHVLSMVPRWPVKTPSS